jgi:CHASE2 domain-containing sensor protein
MREDFASGTIQGTPGKTGLPTPEAWERNHMATVILHFVAGTLGGLAVFLVFTRLSGVTSFSAPFGVIVIGVACAALAHFLSPWATPAIIVIYAVASAMEFLQEQKARKKTRHPENPSAQ